MTKENRKDGGALMVGFAGMGHNRPSKKHVQHTPDCLCLTCDREIHHLGIMSHRAMHRRKGEDCEIVFSDGRLERSRFSRNAVGFRGVRNEG